MNIYIITGKWPYCRYGIEDYVDQKIVYIPEEKVKFCADDREIRDLYSLENKTLERMLDILEKSNSDCIMGHALRSKSTLFTFSRKVDAPIFNEILKAYNDKNRKFFFTHNLFKKPFKL